MRAVLLSLLVCTAASLAHGHALSPASLTLHELEPGEYEQVFTRPLSAQAALRVVLPAQCVVRATREIPRETELASHARVTCKGSLRGATVRILGLETSALDALLYVAFARGEPVRAVLSRARPSLVLPQASTPLQTAIAYARLGAGHLFDGADHLLFVAGLFALTRSLPALLWALSAFTVGHSITLSMSALSWLSLPARACEFGIALSLVLLGAKLVAWPNGGAVPAREFARTGCPFALACGLLHGLGFASALRDAGLPAQARALCLVAFNVGLELAQIVWVSALFALSAFAFAIAKRAIPAGLTVPVASRHALGYGTGGLAVMWCIERALGM